MDAARRVKVTKGNVLQLLTDYTVWKYGEDGIMRHAEECPYSMDFDNDDFVFKQVLFWFMREWKNPDTKKTPLEEFVGEHIRQDRSLAAEVLRTLDLVSGTFVIRGRRGNIIETTGPGSKAYNIWVPPEQANLYAPGRRLFCSIYPWDGVYRFSGITQIAKSDEDIFRETGLIMPGMVDKLTSMMLKGDMEEVILRKDATAASVLNKFPPWLVGEICKSLNIRTRGKKNQKVKAIAAILDSPRVADIVKALPEEARDALDMVRRNGGVIGYGKLIRQFGDDDVGRVNEGGFVRPESPVGMLRMYGLLLVGRMAKGDRFYKVAMVPKEVLQRLADTRRYAFQSL